MMLSRNRTARRGFPRPGAGNLLELKTLLLRGDGTRSVPATFAGKLLWWKTLLLLLALLAAGSEVAPAATGKEDLSQRLTARYANPVVGRFLSSVSTDQSLRLYMESSRLIDSRHLRPSSYQDRVATALRNLRVAAGNREFLQANGLAPSREQVAAFQQSLDRLAESRRVNGSQDALNMLYWTMDLAGRHLGLPPRAVAIEFVYAATESLDEYSAFEPDDMPRRPSANLQDHVVGIGVEIKPHDEGVLIVRPLRGGPAAEAGLQSGDVIVSINGRSLAGRSLDYAVDLIAGPAGSRVLLGVRRDGRPIAPVTIIRRRVEIHSVSEVRLLEDDPRVGYIRLDKFAENSEQEMEEALWHLYRQGMQALVLDLRGNPGGLLTTAVALSNKFLPCGPIVSTRGRSHADSMSESATYERTWKVPLTVLIDENSASASEIFAAAIKENGRGLVVGTRSYGKGTVQTHFALQSASGNLRLTTAKFYSPRGREMAGAGVTPDVEVSVPEAAGGSAAGDRALEAALALARTDKVRQMAEAQRGCGTSQPIGWFRTR